MGEEDPEGDGQFFAFGVEGDDLHVGVELVQELAADAAGGARYLAVLYDYLHEKLYGYHVLQADETPVLVNKDGRPAGSKSYMCYVLSF